MSKKIFVGILAVLMMTSFLEAREIAGVNIPESLQADQTALTLNGAGVRSKLFIKLYVGGLYLEQKSSDPAAIIESDEPMAIRLHIISSMITDEKMEKATREGFLNATNGQVESLKNEIEKFISVFKEIKKNDVYDLIYIPGEGTQVYKNSNYYSLIEGLAFKQALFGIWLCDKPAQRSLKDDMLGQ